ncbi:SMAD/FHA domain-containing protein [Jimgerdemannia flammicorona]|uniref:SMAD/FHA domain-containing protein n=1 Tax=Jimgerdemannia flammicorona TaxID=994334 RepID=A0A433QY64_9FUNG|nr:SMAD/FHA domain-containing protein [Jimgerdemannia flammicorona]
MPETTTMTALATNPAPTNFDETQATTAGPDTAGSKIPTIKTRANNSATTKRSSARSVYAAYTTPALVLHPLNDTFAQKTLELYDKQRVKVGRQTSAKTLPGPTNGYFDSKVLSRTHAEVWSEKGKVFIKDVKSSNGTFLNGQRLSAECEESAPFELNQDDLLEFGIDIMNEDGSVLYHKVACKIGIVPASLDGVANGGIPGAAAMGKDFDFREKSESMQSFHNVHFQGSYRPFPQPTSGSLSKTASPGDSLSPTPSMSASSRANKNAVSVELLVAKLQSELQKSVELGSEIVTVRAMVGEMEHVLSDENLERSVSVDLRICIVGMVRG